MIDDGVLPELEQWRYQRSGVLHERPDVIGARKVLTFAAAHFDLHLFYINYSNTIYVVHKLLYFYISFIICRNCSPCSVNVPSAHAFHMRGQKRACKLMQEGDQLLLTLPHARSYY